MKNSFKSIVDVIFTITESNEIKQATKFVSPNHVVKATRKSYKYNNGKTVKRMNADGNKLELIITIGKPNFAEREYIKKLKKVKEPFPVKKILLKHFA